MSPHLPLPVSHLESLIKAKAVFWGKSDQQIYFDWFTETLKTFQLVSGI